MASKCFKELIRSQLLVCLIFKEKSHEFYESARNNKETVEAAIKHKFKFSDYA